MIRKPDKAPWHLKALSGFSLTALLAACGGGGGNGTTAAAPPPPPPPPQMLADAVVIASGPVTQAHVFIDSDGDLMPDSSAAITDSDGAFTDLGADGPYVASAGIDFFAQVPLTGIFLTAPAGATVISPLTTLLDRGGVDQTTLKTAFALDDAIDLLTFNPNDDIVPFESREVDAANEVVLLYLSAFQRLFAASAENAGAPLSPQEAFLEAIDFLGGIIATGETRLNNTSVLGGFLDTVPLDLPEAIEVFAPGYILTFLENYYNAIIPGNLTNATQAVRFNFSIFEDDLTRIFEVTTEAELQALLDDPTFNIHGLSRADFSRYLNLDTQADTLFAQIDFFEIAAGEPFTLQAQDLLGNDLLGEPALADDIISVSVFSTSEAGLTIDVDFNNITDVTILTASPGRSGEAILSYTVTGPDGASAQGTILLDIFVAPGSPPPPPTPTPLPTPGTGPRVLTIEPVANTFIVLDDDGDFRPDQEATTNSFGELPTDFTVQNPDTALIIEGFPSGGLALPFYSGFGVLGAATNDIISPISTFLAFSDITPDAVASRFGLNQSIDFATFDYYDAALAGDASGLSVLEANGVTALTLASLQALQLVQLTGPSDEDALRNGAQALADYLDSLPGGVQPDFTDAATIEALLNSAGFDFSNLGGERANDIPAAAIANIIDRFDLENPLLRGGLATFEVGLTSFRNALDGLADRNSQSSPIDDLTLFLTRSGLDQLIDAEITALPPQPDFYDPRTDFLTAVPGATLTFPNGFANDLVSNDRAFFPRDQVNIADVTLLPGAPAGVTATLGSLPFDQDGLSVFVPREATGFFGFLYTLDLETSTPTQGVAFVTIDTGSSVPLPGDDTFTFTNQRAQTLDLFANDDPGDQPTPFLQAINGADFPPFGAPFVLPSGALLNFDPFTQVITYDPNGAFNDIALGETATETFTYSISDLNNGLLTATVTIDIPGIPAAGPLTNLTATFAENGSDLGGNQTITFGAGIDAVDATILTVDGISLEEQPAFQGDFGLLKINPDGTYRYTYLPGEADSQVLRDGDVAQDVFTFAAIDAFGNTGSGELRFTITGQDDVPTLQAGADTPNIIQTGVDTPDGAVVAGDILFVADGTNQIARIDLATGENLAPIVFDEEVVLGPLALSVDGASLYAANTVGVGSGGDIFASTGTAAFYTINVATSVVEETQFTTSTGERGVAGLAALASGDVLLVIRTNSTGTGSVRLFDSAQGSVLTSDDFLGSNTPPFFDVAAPASGDFAVLVGRGASPDVLAIYDDTSRTLTQRIGADDFRTGIDSRPIAGGGPIAVSQDAGLIAYLSEAELLVFDLEFNLVSNLTPYVAELFAGETTTVVTALAFTPDGSALYVTEQNTPTIRVFDTQTMQPVLDFGGNDLGSQRFFVSSDAGLVVDRDGDFILAARNDGFERFDLTETADGLAPLIIANEGDLQTAIVATFVRDIGTDNEAIFSLLGPDADAFNFSAFPGNEAQVFVEFAGSPTIDVPADANGDNVFEIDIQITDANGSINTQRVAISLQADPSADQDSQSNQMADSLPILAEQDAAHVHVAEPAYSIIVSAEDIAMSLDV